MDPIGETTAARDLPSLYLNKIRIYLDPTASRSSAKRRIVEDTTSTLVLKDLEVSLRTNNIGWVRQFLSEDFQGLDVLIDYLNFRLSLLRHEQRIDAARLESQVLGQLLNSSNSIRLTNHLTKLNLGRSAEDIHACVMCVRAIMNNEFGLGKLIRNWESVNSLALCLIHKSLRTKALVLDLLATISLASGGHTIILTAFDNFKRVYNERRCFQTLMDCFMNFSDSHTDFQVACMQFVNIVVHSVEDMNYRVHLQYEFTALGLDDYLGKVKSESDELNVQISAYLDNMFNVAKLMEDSETRNTALDRVTELEDNLNNLERETGVKLKEQDKEISKLKLERKVLLQKQQLFQKYESEISKLKQELKRVEKTSQISPSPPVVVAPSQPTAIPPPPPPMIEAPHPPIQPTIPPPPPPISTGAPPPPPPSMNGPKPPPPMGGAQLGGNSKSTTKPPIKTTYKLPTLHWVVLKPDKKLKTIFDELDDDNVYRQLNFNEFEERFKLAEVSKNNNSVVDNTPKKDAKISLLDNDRLRNLAILRRKLDMPVEKTARSINTFDLSVLSLENVEILQKATPTEQEEKLFKLYTADKKDMNLLTDDDLFLFELTKVERLNAKLDMMSYIGNFYERFNVVGQQVSSVISASTSLKSSTKFKAVLEIVLAFGNYLNSGKRGRRDYGFKLQSLNRLCDTKSTDKRMNLLHYVVATIREKFPHLVDFDTELSCIDKAATVTLEIAITDFNDLEKGMEMVKKESKKKSDIIILKDFLVNNEEKFKEMREKTKTAQNAFKECVEFFGESKEKTDAKEFFSLIARFVKEFKTSDQENVKRMRLEQAVLEKQRQKEDEAPLRSKPGQKIQMTSKRTSFVLATPRRNSILESFISEHSAN